MVELEGYEADDLIATYAREAREAGREVIIVSSDKDLMQLIRQGVQMYDPMKQKAIDRAEVIARFGVGPELVRDVLALAGDTSDNVPGVPGIGVKTAAQLLQEFGDLEGLLANAATIKQPKRRENLLEHAEQARLSHSSSPCARRRRAAAARAAAGRPDRLRGAAGVRPRPRLPLARAAGRAAGRERAPERRRRARAPARTALRHGARPRDARAWLERATAGGILAIACPTTSPNIARAELVGLALALEQGEACYLPLAHKDEFGTLSAGQPPRERGAGAPAPGARRPGGAQGRAPAEVPIRACSPATGSSSRPTTTSCCCPT